ncbi:ASCH domain-containing protein [Dinoroseobacter sp. S124A]|uniref:ASCH domain-containing protein n=1 Tax=Dinoroseobacter sp. S124A TaxID=3415128 RepID=UPI003C7CDEA4
MTRTVAELQAQYPGAVTYKFGNAPGLSRVLVDLVRTGKKRATCLSQWSVDKGEALPVVGRCDIVVDFDEVPQLVTRTLELVPVRFCDMTEEMALMEGEDETLEGWRRQHEGYYRDMGIFEPDMLLHWERFEVVEDLSEGTR